MRQAGRYILLIFLASYGLFAQANRIDNKTWEEIEEKFDYPPPEAEKRDTTHKEDQDKREEYKPRKGGKKTQADLTPLQILLYVVIGGAFIALIIFLIRRYSGVMANKKIPLNTEFDEENPDELVLSELQRELNAAALEGNYNRCLRYQFLLLLEKLQEQGRIRWNKHHTNGEYLNQLIDFKHYRTVRELTYIYEYYWYGEHTLKLERYNRLVEHFDHLKERMNDE